MVNKSKFFIFLLIVVIVSWALKTKFTPDKKSSTIKIGVLAPLTGNFEVMGERLKNGMELAKNELLKDNPKLELNIIYEDACESKASLSAFQKLTQINKVSIIGGAICSWGFVPLLPALEERKIINFFTATNPDAVLNRPYTFSTNVSIKDDGKKLAEFAITQLKAKTSAIIYLQSPFGEDYNKYISENFKRLGGQVLTQVGKPTNAQEFRTELTKIKQLKPDVIFTIHFGSPLGNIIKQAREMGITAPLIGDYESEDPTIIEYAGQATEGFIFSSSDLLTETPDVIIFKQKYKQNYNLEADVVASNAYDSLKLQVQAYLTCTGEPNCMALELHKIKNYSGASGIITINQDGVATKPTAFKIIKQGKFIKY